MQNHGCRSHEIRVHLLYGSAAVLKYAQQRKLFYGLLREADSRPERRAVFPPESAIPRLNGDG